MDIDIVIPKSREYYTEIVNFNQQHNLLFKYSDKPISDKRILNYFWLVFGIILAVVSIVGFMVSGFKWIYLITLIAAAAYIITFWLVIDGMKKKVDEQIQLEVDGKLSITQEGLVLEKNNNQIHDLSWNLVQSIRVYKHMIAFVAQRDLAVDFFIPVSYVDDITQSLEKLGYGDKIVHCEIKK